MNYLAISKETIGTLYQSYNSLKKSPLDQTLAALVEILISYINGCEYCIQYHTSDAKKLGIDDAKIDAVLHWEKSDRFTDREKLAFKWATAVTTLQDKAGLDRSILQDTFSEREIVDLTACISLMNALNRIAMTLR